MECSDLVGQQAPRSAHKWMRGLFKEWAIEDAERMKKLKEKDLGVPKYK